MTQAFNLSQLANNLNSSGQLDATDGLTGLVPLANGGTGATNTVNTVVAGSGISVSTSGTQVTVTNTSSATGTVTSVATGNGLSGGTITTSGTLVLACPTFNSIGSYITCRVNSSYPTYIVAGSNYAAGGGYSQINCATVNLPPDNYPTFITGGNSGTWKYMSTSPGNTGPHCFGLACRVA